MNVARSRDSAAAALLAMLIVGEAPAAEGPVDADTRQAIEVDASARARIRAEMRELLTALQGLADALAADDMRAAAKAARSAGMRAVGPIDPKFQAQLPPEFRKLGFGMRGEFDALAADADKLADRNRALRQFGGVLQRCVACHSTYQLRERP